MVRDFIASGPFQNPIAFAERFYAHYPKPAVGIWPPLYYLAAGVWLLVFGTTKTSLLLFSGFLTALFAFVFMLFASNMFGWAASTAMALFLVLVGPVQWASSLIMLDVPVALMQFLAMWCFARFATTGTIPAALLFAVVMATATLVKGNANSMVLLPVFFMLLTGRWDLLKQKGLYWSAALIAALALPWQLITLKMFNSTGLDVPWRLDYALKKLADYTISFFYDIGPAVFVIALFGLAFECIRMRQEDNPLRVKLAAAASLLFSTVVFHVIVPYPPDADNRYMLAAMPCLVLFFGFGVRRAMALLPVLPSLQPFYRYAALALLCILPFAQQTFAVPKRPPLGYREAASALLQEPLKQDSVLVCADSYGEGALIVELAFSDNRPQHTVLRASKMMSKNQWTETEYKPYFQTPSEVGEFLREFSVDSILIDHTASCWPKDRDMLLKAMELGPEKWNIVYQHQGAGFRHRLVLYRRENVDPSKSKTKVRIKMPYGRDIELTR